jgi:hypothetical protein
MVYVVLALLFLYKAFEEYSADRLWGLIYALVGLEYLLDGGRGGGGRA